MTKPRSAANPTDEYTRNGREALAHVRRALPDLDEGAAFMALNHARPSMREIPVEKPSYSPYGASFNFRVHRADLEREFPIRRGDETSGLAAKLGSGTASSASGKAARGRKRGEHWLDIAVEVGAWLEANGVPERLAEVEDHIGKLLVKYDVGAADSTVRAYRERFVRAFTTHRNRS
jgi:hypothetical protein